MSGKSNKDIHPIFLDMLASNGWSNLTDMAKATGVNLTTLRKYAIEGMIPESWIIALQISKAAKMPMEEMINGLLSSADENESLAS